MSQFLGIFFFGIELNSIAKVKDIGLEVLLAVNGTVNGVVIIGIRLKPC
jgi:hypothetical protein